MMWFSAFLDDYPDLLFLCYHSKLKSRKIVSFYFLSKKRLFWWFLNHCDVSLAIETFVAHNWILFCRCFFVENDRKESVTACLIYLSRRTHFGDKLIFLLISDDIEWAKETFSKRRLQDLYFVSDPQTPMEEA